MYPDLTFVSEDKLTLDGPVPVRLIIIVQGDIVEKGWHGIITDGIGITGWHHWHRQGFVIKVSFSFVICVFQGFVGFVDFIEYGHVRASLIDFQLLRPVRFQLFNVNSFTVTIDDQITNPPDSIRCGRGL